MRNLILALLVLLLSGCLSLVDCPSLADVCRPYRNQYGDPEKTSDYDAGDYHSVEWWWPSRGLMVRFESSPYDNYCGWRVAATYRFSP